MAAIREEGEKAREEYTKFCAQVVSVFPDLEVQSCSDWMNQGNNTQKYFRVELKERDCKNYPHNISISLNDKSLTDPLMKWKRSGRSKETGYERERNHP